MANFVDSIKSATDALQVAPTIKTVRTINTGDIQQSAADIAQSEQESGQSQVNIDRGFQQLGSKVGNLSENIANSLQRIQTQKFNQIYNNNVSAISSISADGHTSVANSFNPDEINGYSANSNAAIQGVLDTAKSKLPEDQYNLLQTIANQHLSSLNISASSKISRMVTEDHFNAFKSSFEPQLTGLLNAANQSSNNPAEKKSYLDQLTNISKSIQFFKDNPSNEAMRLQAESMQAKLTGTLEYVTSSNPNQSISLASNNLRDTTSSVGIYNGGLRKDYLDGIGLRSADPNKLPAGLPTVKQYNDYRNEGLDVQKFVNDYKTSSVGLSFLHDNLNSNDPLRIKYAKKYINMINNGHAIELRTSIDPTGSLTLSQNNYNRVLSDQNSSIDDKKIAYAQLKSNIISDSSYSGIPINKYTIPTPGLDSLSEQTKDSGYSYDKNGKLENIVINNTVGNLTTAVLKARYDAVGNDPLIGNSSTILGVNLASMEPGFMGQPINSDQSSLDLLSAHPSFQNFQSKQLGLFPVSISGNKVTPGMLPYKSHNALLVDLSSKKEVIEGALGLGVSVQEQARIIASQIEYRAANGDTDATNTVLKQASIRNKNYDNVYLSNQGWLDGWINGGSTIHASRPVLTGYTGGADLTDDDYLSWGNKVGTNAYNAKFKQVAQMIEAARKESGQNLNSRGEPNLTATEAALIKPQVESIIGKYSDYILQSNGTKLLLKRAGGVSSDIDINPIYAIKTGQEISHDEVDRKKARSIGSSVQADDLAPFNLGLDNG